MFFTYDYLFYAPINFIYAIFIFIYGFKKKKTYPYYVFAVIFAIYINSAINLAYFPIITASINEWGNAGNFMDMSFNFFEIGGKYQIIGNILLTVPIGIFLPFVCGLKTHTRGFFVIGISLAIELIQLIIIYFLHSVTLFFDIKDMILNFAGGLIGILLFRMVSQLIVKYISPPINNKFLEYIYETCKE